MSGFIRHTALLGSSSIYTRSLRHAKAVLPRLWSKRVAWADPHLKHVKPKDRIKWWNIVPGDQIRLRGDTESVLREVQSVNKLTNMVYLRRETELHKTNAATQSQGVHYSKCQLFIGKHQFPPEEGSSEPKVLPVFATRVDMTNPRWLRQKGYYFWKRIAANTTPRLPGSADKAEERMVIPWPTPSARPKTRPSAYDTPAEVVKAITYVLPRLPSALNFVPKPPTQQAYINAIRKGKNVDPAAPMEVHVTRELSNPHSRAKKQARWKAAQTHRRELLEEIVKAEVQNLDGRTRKVAKQEAIFKWKVRLEEERKAEMHRRRVLRGEVARFERQKVMKVRKAARLEKKLSGLELRPTANQVIPAAPSQSAITA
ncbi:hypothetical protein BC835DRAFT_1412933 [Cytidiella melzeri]|nr:hypothetical protein BC835DRAFT_1412933 [Cytidiella melzeri]